MYVAAVSDPPPSEPAPRKPRRSVVVRALLLLVGVALLGGFVYAAGPAEIAANVATIGWGFFWLLGLSIVWRALASTGMWLLFEPEHALPWWKVMLIRSAGETVNMLTPFGNVGGEPVKALMLKRELGGARGTGYVILDKTIFFLASVVFMTSGTLVGAIVLAEHVWLLGITIAMLVPWVITLTWIVRRQVRGDFVVTLSRLLKLVRVELSEKRRQKLAIVDETMSTFWRGHKGRFFASLFIHFLGRALRAVDVWLCVYLLGESITWSGAYFSAAAGMLVSATLVFIPGGLGASEGGHAFVFEAIGLGVTAGVTVALVRRIRNYVMAAMGYPILVLWPTDDRSKR